ncbi:hypothetical protein GCM10007860_09250 [Chitiniphilus shinanonensis]|uniref:Glycine-rich domain-containing protein n=1 Tax=Chitiniphilus shinanonensis TaxID=553088 RepID=A0ABQ6BP35_9NEIS|nr:hypothetical protein [Chitiniphilus shinanonensis]GLS03780.1 hypothetical protein GCM10007860_09250 [Chitiniphilus shinanonensis]
MDYPHSISGVNLLNGKFTDGNPQTGQLPSRDTAAWSNAVTDELLSVIQAAGMTPTEGLNSQLLEALRAVGVFTTRPPADNTTAAATTAFVQSAIAAATGRLIGVQVFSNPGTSTYTPTLGTTSVIVEVVGGGGGSGGLAATGAAQNAIAGCGGNGSYAKSRLTSGFSGVSVTVGAGGMGGSVGTGSGGSGGTSSFGALVSCPGGGGSIAGGAVSGPTNGSGGAGAGAPSGANILGVPGVQGCWPVIPAIGAGAMAIQPQTLLGGYGTGAAQNYSGTNSAARAGNFGGQGQVIVWEYA